MSEMNPFEPPKQTTPSLDANSAPVSNTGEALSLEEKKNRSRKRIFWVFVGVDIALSFVLLYAIIDLFLS